VQSWHLLARPAEGPLLMGEGHTARITCLLPSAVRDAFLAVTGSADRTIRCRSYVEQTASYARS